MSMAILVGCGPIGLSAALSVALEDESVLICDDDKAIAMCGHPLANIGIDPFSVAVQIPDRCNAFRGGSRGKGGKIKYARK